MSSRRLWCFLFFVCLLSPQISSAKTTTDVLVPQEDGNPLSDEPQPAAPPQPTTAQNPLPSVNDGQSSAIVPQSPIVPPPILQSQSPPSTPLATQSTQDNRPYKTKNSGENTQPDLSTYLKPSQETKILETPEAMVKAMDQQSANLPKHPTLPTNKLQISVGQLPTLGQREYDAVKTKLDIQMYDFTHQCSVFFDGYVSSDDGYVAFWRAPQGSSSVTYWGDLKHLVINRKIQCPATTQTRSNAGTIRKVGNNFQFPLGSWPCAVSQGAHSVSISYDPVKRISCDSH